MSLELIRETIRVNQVIGEDSIQTVVENDIIVPDVKPDIAHILLLDGDAIVNNAEAMQDKVLVNGTVNFKILYISEDSDQKIKSINTNANFSYNLDVPETKPGMNCNARCDVEHIEYSILNGRKINVKAIVKISGKVVDELRQDVVNGLDGIDDIQVLRENATINCYLGDNEMDYNLSELMEIPSSKPTIREILRNDIKITGKDYKITDNKVIARGELNVSTLYVCDDAEGSIQFMEHEIPFTQFIDLQGISESAGCDIDFRVDEYRFEPEEDSDGELRMLNCEAVIKISVSGYEKRSIDLISDAYSPRARLNLEREPFKMEEIFAENNSQIILKDTVAPNEDSPEIIEVFNVLCKPSLTECKVLADKVVLEGVVNNSVLYLANNSDQPVFCCEQEVPFKHNIDIKGLESNMGCEVNLDVEHCNYSMVSSNEVEIRMVVGASIKVLDQVEFPFISRVSEIPLDEKRLASQPGIIIYFSQDGDTLWTVAKKYYTTIDDILRVNNLSGNETIKPGQQIIIPKRVS